MFYKRFLCLTAVSILAVSMLAGCGSKSRAGVEKAYQLYRTTDSYIASDSAASDAVSLFAADLCVGGDTDTVPEEGFDNSRAEAAAVFTLENGEITFAKNIYDKMYPASTTKILTAYIALKYGNPTDEITVTQEDLSTLDPASSVCGLKVGDTLTLKDCIYGLMLCSGNDAANVIATHVSGSTEEFAKLMNEEALKLGATGSHFVNAHGLPDENHYTTPYDLYLIFNEAIKNKDFVDVISAKSIDVTYKNAEGVAETRTWENTNYYLTGAAEAPENITVIGGKTGTTNAAGNCLVLYSENEKKEPIISVVMKGDSKDHLYQMTTDLLSDYSK